MNTNIAHELWAAAQLAPGEGIEDGVDRMQAALNGYVLVLIIPTPAMCDVIGNRYGAYETAEELYEALLQAAQGENK